MEDRRKEVSSTAKAKSRALVDNDQPAWVCYECGVKYGFWKAGIATWHSDTCGVCNQEKSVTEPRDFGYLAKGWKEKRDAD